MSKGKQCRKRKIINWPEHNAALVNRGSLTFWFDRDIEKLWFHQKAEPTSWGWIRPLVMWCCKAG